MYKIQQKLILAKDIKRLDISAAQIASKYKPGQFVSVCIEEGDERIPLAVIDVDQRKGIISVIVQETGCKTRKLSNLPIGESVYSVLGPLGVGAKIEKKGTVICIATGIGTAQILPIARAFKDAGNKVIGIIGAKTKNKLMLEPQIRMACDRVFLTTEDGSYDQKGLATDKLENILDEDKVDLVYAIGCGEMMDTVSALTRVKKIKTLVHLNPVMVDCMGMCGACRVVVGGKTVLACTQGPEFDGHKVDYQDYKMRIKAFEEVDECQTSKLQFNQKKKESKTFMKSLWGYLKG